MILKDLLKFINNNNLSCMLKPSENEDIEITEISFEMPVDDLLFAYHINLRTGKLNVSSTFL